ncbi:MAG: 50S ribosomal protein L11 methyltransferase [Saprospiraceae bacterium]
MSATRCYSIETGSLQPETVIALLGDWPFGGFEVEENLVKAYVPEPKDSDVLAQALRQLADRFGLTISVETLPDINWNARWEENYKPVEIDKFLRISAPFHPKVEGFANEIVLIPEMSFGTGHHETTYLMSTYLRDYSPFGKTCFDFGTGTGVLAILAKMLGTTHTAASDIDERCITSTLENAERNGVVLEEVFQGTEDNLPEGPIDLILANINRSVLVKTIPSLANRLTDKGELWLSGILETDLPLIDGVANSSSLVRVEHRQKGQWLACRYAPKTIA